MIGHYRYASARMLIPHKPDVFHREIEIISGLDNEKQQLERLKRARQFINARYRSQDPEMSRTEDSGNTFSD